jgi:hypothetical protein
MMHTCKYIKDYLAEAAFNEVTLFTSRMDLNMRNKLAKRCIWSIVLRGGEYWTLRKLRKKYPEIFEI